MDLRSKAPVLATFVTFTILTTGCLDKIVGKNFHVVEEGKLYRSAQLKAKDLEKTIREHGIKTVINLRGEMPGQPWYEDEVAVTQRNGVQLISIPMSASRIPHKREIQALLDAYRNALRPMLVHCQYGADRTGEASAIYQIEYMGKSNKEAAKASLKAKYFHVLPKTKAKDYFVKEVYQGENWAFTTYDPCVQKYKYYDQAKFCTGDTEPGVITDPSEVDDPTEE